MLIELAVEKTINVFLLILEEMFGSVDIATIYQHFVTLYDVFLDILSYVFFFLPVPYLMPLFLVVFGVLTVRFTIALFRLVFNLLDGIPLIG